MEPKYKRVLLKLSGEALAQGADGKAIYNFDLLTEICSKIRDCVNLGVEVALVVGAGNIWRGKQGTDFQRVRADHMGMLATCINALALQDTLEHLGVDARVMSAVEMETFTETYIRDKAVSHLKNGKVVIFACGIGSPYFSTDTAAVLRAKEIDAEIVLLAKNIDAVKRRTRAGMGRSQGGFCQPQVAEIIARTLDIPLEKVTKNGEGSALVVGVSK